MMVRIATGFVLALIAIWASFLLSTLGFTILVGIVILLASIEWSRLITANKIGRLLFVLSVFGLSWLSHFVPESCIVIATLFWLLASCSLALPMSRLTWIKHPVVLWVVGYLVLVPTWVAAVYLHQLGHLVVFSVIMFVCFADTGAYFVGARCGKHALAPALSPKKTWEGLAGGLIIGLIAGMAMVVLMPGMTWKEALSWLVLGIVIILVSMLGDLFESLIKRQCDLKDSGQMLPGHGGILDRVDSLCAALPVYAFFLLLFLH